LPVSTLDYSPRLRAWLGIDQQEKITVERAYESIRPADRVGVREAMLAAIAPNSSQLYDVEYVVNVKSGQQPRILHAQGKAAFDEMGVAYRINGFVQDVTLQRNTQLLLEQQVQERTEELAAINEELTATSDELAQANQELEDSNVNLSRSNKNLEQFAYIASHDLQEPLRKIQQFGDLLKTRFDGSPGEDLVYLDRMQSAAKRMSNLIRDLLAYSRISTGQIVNTSVSLNQVVNQALDNLSVVVEETKAQIQRDDLPTVLGDKTQLGQLFLNLLSNAFKFSSQNKSGEAAVPRIVITHRQIQDIDLPADVKPNRYAETYHLIDVRDNGIGFDKKYVDRIFQVFQRLHGKNEFAGTGVGLAIVEKVVANHGGAITAASKPGEGATFSVYLPA
jgi:light-regulated signal transduction histidine kinase (bacteriophytochrome)